MSEQIAQVSAPTAVISPPPAAAPGSAAEAKPASPTAPTPPPAGEAAKSEDTTKWLVEQAKKDKALRAQAARIKQADAEFKQKQQQFEQKQKDWESKKGDFVSRKELAERAKQDEFGVLEEVFGSDGFQRLVKKAAVGEGAPMSPEARKIAELEKWKTDFEKQREESQKQFVSQQKQQEEQAKVNYKKHIGETIASAKEYPLTKVFGPAASDLAWAVIEQHHKETNGQIMPLPTALGKVEQYYKGIYEALHKAFTESATPPVVSQDIKEPPIKQAKELPKDYFQAKQTLSNNLTSSTVPTQAKKLSSEERKRRFEESAKRLLTKQSA